MSLSKHAECIRRIAHEIVIEIEKDAATAADKGTPRTRPPLTIEDALKMLSLGERLDGDDRVWRRFNDRINTARESARGVLTDRRAIGLPVVVTLDDADKPSSKQDLDLIDSITDAVIDSIKARGLHYPELRSWLASALAELGYPAT